MNAMLHHQDVFREGVQRHQQEAREWARRDRLARLARASQTATVDGGMSGIPLSLMHRLRLRLGRLWASLIQQVPGRTPGTPPASRPGTGAERAPRTTDHLTLLLREKRLRRATGESGRARMARTTVATEHGPAMRGPRSASPPRSSLAHGPARRRSSAAASARSRDD